MGSEGLAADTPLRDQDSLFLPFFWAVRNRGARMGISQVPVFAQLVYTFTRLSKAHPLRHLTEERPPGPELQTAESTMVAEAWQAEPGEHIMTREGTLGVAAGSANPKPPQRHTSCSKVTPPALTQNASSQEPPLRHCSPWGHSFRPPRFTPVVTVPNLFLKWSPGGLKP